MIKNQELTTLGKKKFITFFSFTNFLFLFFVTCSKTIRLEDPDGDDINYIKGDYECDQYIDCANMSDEGYHCTPSFVIAFIIVGILTGIIILVSCLFIPIVIVFGIFVRRHRIFLSGTIFLFILVISSIVGFISTYAWYGKPHPVACNFQLWLFGLSTTSLAW